MAVLTDTGSSIFSGIGGIFQYWYQYQNNSNPNSLTYRETPPTNESYAGWQIVGTCKLTVNMKNCGLPKNLKRKTPFTWAGFFHLKHGVV